MPNIVDVAEYLDMANEIDDLRMEIEERDNYIQYLRTELADLENRFNIYRGDQFVRILDSVERF
jgi:hypothetical protein